MVKGIEYKTSSGKRYYFHLIYLLHLHLEGLCFA